LTTRQRRIPSMGEERTTRFYILTRAKFLNVNCLPSNFTLMIMETLAQLFKEPRDRKRQ
jgi:hypothetical protein